MSFSSHFLFFVLVEKSYEKPKYYIIVSFFSIIFHFCFACLALQTKNIVPKIPQPIFVFGNFVNQKKNRKWDEKLTNVCMTFCGIPPHHGHWTYRDDLHNISVFIRSFIVTYHFIEYLIKGQRFGDLYLRISHGGYGLRTLGFDYWGHP